MTLDSRPTSPASRRVDVVKRPSPAPIGVPVTASVWALRGDAMRASIAERTLPFWYDHAYVGSARGYRLGYDAVRGTVEEETQLLVSQARLVWTFARAHRLGYSNGSRDYLAAARHGFDHLQNAFHDPGSGGYFWRVRQGATYDSRKVLYGNAFALYAIVEYSRAANDSSALDKALGVFDVLASVVPGATQSLVDSESAAADFKTVGIVGRDVDGIAAPGYRCANTVLHWMEALTELYADTRDARVGRALVEATDLNAIDFYPPDLGKCRNFIAGDESAAPWRQPSVVSYGHNVEFGWLMIGAQESLGLEPDFARLESIVAHALRYGFDAERGGLFNLGAGNLPAHNREKTWWPQAEMIAALTCLISCGRASRSYADELRLMLDWYAGPQMHASTGTPYSEVSEDGTRVTDAALSSQWQAAYHDLRARWLFIEAFAEPSTATR